jgi:hypothetical protein
MTFKKIIRVVSATHTRVGHEGWPKNPQMARSGSATPFLAIEVARATPNSTYIYI